MSLITINNISYNTKNYDDRYTLGLMYEKEFLEFLHKKNLKYIHISNTERYNRYDFFKKSKNDIKIIELKTRLKNIKCHNIVYLDKKKIQFYSQLAKNIDNIYFYYIFNFLDINNKTNEYFIYQVNFEEIEEIGFLTKICGKDSYEINIKYLKKLEDNIDLLK